MKLDKVIENLIAEFGDDSDRSRCADIVSIICKAFKNPNVPDDKAEILMRVGRQLRVLGVK